MPKDEHVESTLVSFLRCCKWHQPISLSWAGAWAQQWRCHWFQPKTAWHCMVSSPLLSVARTKHVFRVIPVLFPESAVETICRKVPCSLVLMGKTMVSYGISIWNLATAFPSGWEVLLWRTSSDCSFPEPQGCPGSAARQVKEFMAGVWEELGLLMDYNGLLWIFAISRSFFV